MKKLFILSLIVSLAMPFFSYAAIQFDAAAASDPGVFSISNTGTSTSNHNLAVIGCIKSPGDVLTGVTYGGISGTYLASVDPSNAYTNYLYYVPNALTGTQTSTCVYSVGHGLGIAVETLLGAGSAEATSSALQTTASLTLTTTTVTNNDWLVGFWLTNSVSISSGASTTIHASNGNVSTYTIGIGDSNGPKSPPGIWSITANGSGTSEFDGTLVAIKPFVATSTAPISRRKIILVN